MKTVLKRVIAVSFHVVPTYSTLSSQKSSVVTLFLEVNSAVAH
jgi:hypothetical protein